MKKKSLTFVTLHENTLKDVLDQCFELGVMDDCAVEGRAFSQLAYRPLADDTLVVASSDVILSALKNYLPRGVTVITAKRAVRYANLRALLEIPRHAKVLLVNDSKPRALDTIAALEELGFDLEFHPFFPGEVGYPPDITIAVTPGEVRFVPDGVPKVIDIGSRVIALSTWLEIAAHFSYAAPDLDKLTSRYMRSLTDITQVLSKEMQNATLQRRHLEAILAHIEDGVLALDTDGAVRITNHKALEILQLQGRSLIGFKAADCLPAHFYQLMCQLPYEGEEVVQWENQSFFVRKTHLVIEGRNCGSLVLFRRASEINKLELDYRRKQMSKGLVAKHAFSDLVGSSAPFKKAVDEAKKMASGGGTILLLGETGTGKELLAQAIHNASPRKWEPFVGVNFAAISESLLESELFGYEEGAFTGAKKGGHVGLFEQAHKGTIFLDEIGDASPLIQNRLLRVLQEREIMKVGGSRVVPVDIRVIAATNRDLAKMVQDGLFRADLYYRLNVLPVPVPALRERKEDISVLAQHFIRASCREIGRPLFQLSKAALDVMLAYAWPGNIRELENTVQYLAHVVGERVLPQQLPFNQPRAAATYAVEDKHAQQELEPLYQTYVVRGFIRDVRRILKIVQQASHAVGRNYVIDCLQKDGSIVTEQQIRYRMLLLKQDGLLEVGRGRQGSVITPKGTAFLQYIQQ